MIVTIRTNNIRQHSVLNQYSLKNVYARTKSSCKHKIMIIHGFMFTKKVVKN